MEAAILEHIFGPLGGFVLAIVMLGAIVYKRGLVPSYVLDTAEKRIEHLEGENHTLNASVLEMNRQNSDLKVEVAGLRKEVEYLREEIAELRKRVKDA